MSRNPGQTGRSSLHKRVLALIASLSMLTMGLLGVVFAPAASAHHPENSGTGACQPDGTFLITWTITNPGWEDRTMKVTSSSRGVFDGVVVEAGDSTNKTESVPGNVAAFYTMSASATFYAADDDDFSHPKASGSTPTPLPKVVVAGNCAQPTYDAPGGWADYCVNGVNKHVEWAGVTGAASPAAAAAAVLVKKNAALVAAGVPQGTPEGNCTYDAPGGWADYCVNGVNKHVEWAGVTGAASPAAAAAAVLVKKNAALLAAGVPQGTAEGKCTYDLPGGSAKYCVDDKTVEVEWAGVTGAASPEAAAAAVAKNKADALKAADVPANTPEGKCIYKYSVTKTAETTICYNGRTKNIEVSGDKVTIPEQDTPITPQQKATADAQAQASANAALAEELEEYPGYKEGECVPAEEGSLTCESGLTLKLTDYWPGTPVLITGLPGGDTGGNVGQDGTFSFGPSGALPDGDYVVKVYVGGNPALRIQEIEWTEVLKLTVNCTPDGKTYSAGASTSASLTICTAAGETKTVTAQGSGVATSPTSQNEAQTAANNAAAAEAAANLKAALAGFPGYTEGACVPQGIVPPTVVEPAVVPAQPAKPKPAKVIVPQEATVPASVPAGDGSQAPGLPLWALAMVVVGVIGAAGSAMQIRGARK